MSIDNRLFYFNHIGNVGDIVEINDEERYHLEKVLRCKVGDVIHATDGNGSFSDCRIAVLEKKKCAVEVLSKTYASEYPLRIHLFCAITKRDKFEWLIEKSTESGIYSITPLLCERNREYAKREKVERYEKIAASAMKQSRRPFLPHINSIHTCADVVALPYPEEVYILTFGATHFTSRDGRCKECGLIIGPEGGFTAAEESLFFTWGASGRGFGEYTLKTETAALKAIMLLNHYRGEF